MKKARVIAGYLMVGFTLPFIIGFTSLYYQNILFFLIYLSPWFFVLFRSPSAYFLLFIVNLIGLGLIFFSIKPKSRAYFSIIFGYLLFMIFFLIQPPINSNSIVFVPFFLIFIDIPPLIMIGFGVYSIYHLEQQRISDKIKFLPIVISNIFPYILYSYYFYFGY